MKATLINHMGSDRTVVSAARVSLNKKSDQYTPAQNAKLIHYLAAHGHFTPFTHPQATFHIRAPIFVARQLFKSKIGFSGDDDAVPDEPFTENEISRRYVDDEPTFFVPNFWRPRSSHKKQGSGEGEITELDVTSLATGKHYGVTPTELVLEAYKRGKDYYNMLISCGIAPEQARMVLPQGMETEWYWTGSLAAWARLHRLRTASDAQRETGEIAHQIAEALAPLFPVSWAALTKGGGAT